MASLINKFKKLFTSKSLPVYPTDGEMIPFVSKDFVQNLFRSGTYQTSDDFIKAYKEVPPIAYIINKKLVAINKGIIGTNEAKLSVKGKNILSLLKSPNPLQTQSQFLAQIYGYTQLCGFVIILKAKPIGDAISSLMVLPPHLCNIEWKTFKNTLFLNDIKDVIKSVKFGTSNELLPLDDLYFITDTTLSLENSALPSSRLASIGPTIDNLKAIYEAKGVIIKNRGALGILSSDMKDASGVIKITDDEVEQLQKNYKHYGLSRDQWQILITTASVKWQSITMPIKDLMLNEMRKEDVLELCDTIGYERNLLAITEGTTYDNTTEADRQNYQNNIIPDAENIIQQLTDLLELRKYGIELTISFDHIECLQLNKKSESETKKNNVSALVQQFMSNGITHKRYLELLGEDPNKGQDKLLYELPELFESLKLNTHEQSKGQQAN
jgi:phage portal protein BeeE